jgi:hypothetical protein
MRTPPAVRSLRTSYRLCSQGTVSPGWKRALLRGEDYLVQPGILLPNRIQNVEVSDTTEAS